MGTALAGLDSFHLAASGSRVEILDLGRCEYAEVERLQKRLIAERVQGSRPDTLIFVEHPAVFTRGATARNQTIPTLPHPVFDVDRGGDITFHGPGQLIGYPILHLGERGLKVGTYLRTLEEVLIATLKFLGLDAQRVPGLTGVWCRDKKVASIGVAVKGWVSYHGFALNVSCDLEQFSAIRPCGLEASAMTSLERLLRRNVNLDEAREKVLEAFLESF